MGGRGHQSPRCKDIWYGKIDRQEYHTHLKKESWKCPINSAQWPNSSIHLCLLTCCFVLTDSFLRLWRQPSVTPDDYKPSPTACSSIGCAWPLDRVNSGKQSQSTEWSFKVQHIILPRRPGRWCVSNTFLLPNTLQDSVLLLGEMAIGCRLLWQDGPQPTCLQLLWEPALQFLPAQGLRMSASYDCLRWMPFLL